jgi:hypothetical protein
MEVDFSLRVIATPDVLFRQVREEGVLLNLADEHYFSTDEVGARMWSLLTSARSIRQAYDALLDEYDVDAGRLHDDLDGFVRELVQRGLVRLERTDG